MTNPPSSLPSPTPSSSSSSHPQYQSIFQMQHSAPPRAPSAASGISVSSGRDGRIPNGTVGGDRSSPAAYGDYPLNGQSTHHGFTFQPPIPPAFLPAITSSPPPHPPPYVPPPQHAMAPDPIHSITPGSQGFAMNQVSAVPGGGLTGIWPGGPPPPSGWRGIPVTAQLSGYAGHQPYVRGALPNGHLSTQIERGPFPQGLTSRGGSSHGEPRDRRRERDRRDKDDERGDREEDEIITTIFVVGFPDDMLEREFQNIFTFAPGFEAATLKFPSGSSRREPSAALLAELTQLAAAQQAAQAAGEELPPGFEEAMAAVTMAATTSTSTSTTPSAAISLTPSAPSGPVLGNQPNLPSRRQTIGFARFRTRADALAAREQLQGTKIDLLTGATLKAEMAKKNLHTKRATSGEELVGLLIRSGRLANLVNQGGINGSSSSIVPQQVPLAIGRDAWDAWSMDRDRQRERQSIDDSRSMPPPPVPVSIPPSSQSGNLSGATSIQQTQNVNQGGNINSAHTPSFLPSSISSTSSTFNPATATSLPNTYASTQSNPSASPPLSAKSPTQRPTDSKALLALAEEADELEGWSVNGALGMGMMDGYHAPRKIDGSTQRGFGQSYGAGFGPRHAGAEPGYGTSPPGGSDSLSESGRGLLNGANPADQNPPINTLYVGNLPAISPLTHPPNFLEESLRGLFARCQGFKRMSFRQKINGPMCFVEFEEVVYASQAIKDLYGHNLGGLVKGGIRLSYSKNSLGQRGNGHPSSLNTSMFGGIAHTVALAGMSMTSPTSAAPHLLPPTSTGGSNSIPIPMSANSGYGLQSHQTSSGQQQQQAPANAPIPDVRRDGGPNITQGTSLSPTAQPFNSATSPRGRFYTSPPPSSDLSTPNSGGVPIPSTSNGPHAFQAFNSGSAGSNNSASGPSSASQFSPVSSPIKTPASFSWLSSGNTGPSNGAGIGGVGSGGVGRVSGYGYEFAPSAPLGSLNGAASAWGQSANVDQRRE